MTFAQASCGLTALSHLKNSLQLSSNYIQTTNRRVTFEYIMLNEVNDHPENAQELADLTQENP